MKRVAILGATGSIGQQTLAVLKLHPEDYQVFAVSAHSNVVALADIIQTWQPRIAIMVKSQAYAELCELKQQRGWTTELLAGEQALAELAQAHEVDIVVAGIMGAAGLASSLAAVRAGKRVLLANKEPLVMAGRLFIEAAEQSGAELLPVDSEHNALFQCLPQDLKLGQAPAGVVGITLTASGGALRDVPLTELAHVTPEQALQHPNWSMGAKITIDSATMMNKGLEVIEAYHLFGLPLDAIDVVLHPQSVIHAWVSYQDGSQLMHGGVPDMRIPITHALSWPTRIASGVMTQPDWKRLDFMPIDDERYPCFKLALQALEAGSSMPLVLNAANEVLVEAFLQRQIGFQAIHTLMMDIIEQHEPVPLHHLQDCLQLDQTIREQVLQQLKRT